MKAPMYLMFLAMFAIMFSGCEKKNVVLSKTISSADLPMETIHNLASERTQEIGLGRTYDLVGWQLSSDGQSITVYFNITYSNGEIGRDTNPEVLTKVSTDQGEKWIREKQQWVYCN